MAMNVGSSDGDDDDGFSWGDDAGDLPALQTQVYELRALVDRPFAQPLIQSVRGVGYRLVAAP